LHNDDTIASSRSASPSRNGSTDHRILIEFHKPIINYEKNQVWHA